MQRKKYKTKKRKKEKVEKRTSKNIMKGKSLHYTVNEMYFSQKLEIYVCYCYTYMNDDDKLSACLLEKI